MTKDVCKHCGEAIWAEWPDAGGAPWRDAGDKSHCEGNPARDWMTGRVKRGAFGPHQVWVKPEEVDAAITSIMEAHKS